MRIIIAGGSGFIGTALTKSLLEEGHQVWILTRNIQTDRLVEGAKAIVWDARTTNGWLDEVSKMDGIVNLAGENIGAWFWTGPRKKKILTSRVEAGKAISEAIRKANPRPKVLIQASAVGFYGNCNDEPVTEESAPGHGFLAEVCKEWEASSQPVEELGVRRVVIRTGVVLSKNEGALHRMILPFRLFTGGQLGNGQQGLPWIHPTDEVEAIKFLLENEKAQGIFNLSAPGSISNTSFGRILAKVMRRPFWLSIPAFALRLFLGEMSSLILEGQYMLPNRLLELGFRFKYESAEIALRNLLSVN
jgi:uncharacterized protein (TIGR01777 family)